jgi:glycosyltransferase involved in cell wall biosynthesis
MRIAIDLSAVRTTGTLVYCQGFLPAFVRLLTDSDELTLFGPEDIRGIVAPLLNSNIHFVGNPILKNVPRRIWWQQTALPRALAKIRADVLFEPYDMGPWRAHCPMVVGIRNPNPVILAGGVLPPTLSRRVFGGLHKALVSQACRRAKLLIFPSRYAADAVGGLLPGRPEQRRVVHHGLDTEFWTNESVSPAPREKYILFASKFYQQKRAALLLEAFSEWRQRSGRTEYKLIYCGEPPGSLAAQAVLTRATELGLADAVEMRGIVGRLEVLDLYRRAAELVLPTIMETFGFPYIEAMASATPLVCADIAIARELCGDAPWYFRPDDRDSLAAALEAALAGGPERIAKLALGEKLAQQFSWQREAKETLACLREAASIT